MRWILYDRALFWDQILSLCFPAWLTNYNKMWWLKLASNKGVTPNTHACFLQSDVDWTLQMRECIFDMIYTVRSKQAQVYSRPKWNRGLQLVTTCSAAALWEFTNARNPTFFTEDKRVADACKMQKTNWIEDWKYCWVKGGPAGPPAKRNLNFKLRNISTSWHLTHYDTMTICSCRTISICIGSAQLMAAMNLANLVVTG